MRTSRKQAMKTLCAATTLLLLGGTALADTVRMKNGDVLTGSVVRLDDKGLVLDTDYADEITIDPEDIDSMVTEEEFVVRWEDGSERVGRIEVSDQGTNQVVDPPASADNKRMLADNQEEAAAATDAAREMAAKKSPGAVADSESGRLDLDRVASMKKVEPYYRYSGNINAGINVSRGNTDTTDIHVDGEIAPSFGRNTILFGGQLNKSEASGETTASNWRIRAQYDRSFGPRRRWFANVFNTYENDELADLNLRITAGAGLGYIFFKDDPTWLRISLGPAFVNENFREEADRAFLGLRWALDFEQKLWSDDLSFYHNDTMTFGLSETQYVLYTTTGLKVGLLDNLSLNAEFQYNYNGEPADDAVKDDERFIFKLGYTFGGDEDDWWGDW